MLIGLMSDTHGHVPDSVFRHFDKVDEVWHAGDVGGNSVLEKLQAFKPFRGVWGNIDGADIRYQFPETNIFPAEEMKVMIRHIGGYPGRYAPGVKALLMQESPGLFISGHSHILKVQYDAQHVCMHMNPGACGLQGWHKIKTLLRFRIEGKIISQLEVIELR